MKDVLRVTSEKMRATVAAGALSLVALNSCAMPKNAEEEVVVRECAVHVDQDTDKTYIQRLAEKSGVDESTLTNQIKQLNSGIDINHLSRGDDIALGATACNGLLDNRDAVYEFDIRLLPDNASMNQ